MWCGCSKQKGDQRAQETQPTALQESVLAGSDTRVAEGLTVGGSCRRATWFKIAALGLGGALAPHALCVIGGLGLAGAGLGGWKIASWCHHSSEGFGVNLPKVQMPKQWESLSTGNAQGAWERLLAAEPGLQKVLERKADNAQGEPIQVQFIRDTENGRISVLICSKVAMCPCKGDERAQYDVSHLPDIVQMVNANAGH